MNLRHLRIENRRPKGKPNLRDKKNQHKKAISVRKQNQHENKRAPTTFVIEALDKRRRLPTLPHCIAVPSAQVSLTSLFGMGRGGTSPQ